MISIIIPVYNPGKYFARCLDSIIAQTITDWELIAIDDCSTDSSYDILQGYAVMDSRIKISRNPENLGCGITRRMCINKASGDWFAFVDSDDYIDNCFLSEMLRACRIWDAEIAVCGTYNRDESGKYISQDIAEDYDTFTGGESYAKYMQTTYIKQYNANKLFSRRVIETVEYSPRRFCEDSSTTYLWMWNAQKIAVMPTPLYHYCHRTESNSNREESIEKLTDRVSCFWEHYLFCSENNFKEISDKHVEPSLRQELTKGLMLATIDSKEYNVLNEIRIKYFELKTKNND